MASKSNQPGDRDVVLGGNDSSDGQGKNNTQNNAPDNAAILGGAKPLRRWHLLFQEPPHQFDPDRELATWQSEQAQSDRPQNQDGQQMRTESC
jgi:hypothetical protein